MLKGNNTTQCFFGNWTGMTPWCKEGMKKKHLYVKIPKIPTSFFPVYCPFPGFIDRGKILLVGSMGLYEYRPYVRQEKNDDALLHLKIVSILKSICCGRDIGGNI